MSVKVTGWVLVVIGMLVVLFSPIIVIPGLERTLGIETIVGRENVRYHPDGSYHFTNPGAVVRWTASVAGIGVVIVAVGVVGILKAWRKGREPAAAPNGGPAAPSGNSEVPKGPPSVT
jgi:hypothetical protein